MSLSLLGCVPYARAGFGGKLVADFVAHFERVRPFFRRDPRSEADWEALLAELRAHAYPREELAGVLVKAGEACHAPQAALDHARALARPGVFAVLTGQQAGLFGGPLYSLFKALSAIKLARALTRKSGGTAAFVPVFWVASDDHDLDEIDHADFLDKGGELRRLRAEIGADAKGAAALDVTIRESIEALREPLEKLLPAAAQGLLAPYRKRNLGSAFARLMTKWLGPLGLVVVESFDIRRFGRELFARELDEFARSCEAVRSSGRRLEAAGYQAGLRERADTTHLFVSSNTIRARLDPLDGGASFRERSPAFAARGLEPDTYAKDVLKCSIQTAPEQFSPSAALRPVLQELAFPVAAAILGPGEMRYWAQLAGLHEQYGAPWPMIVPRASFTLLDGKGFKAFRKLKAGVSDLFLPAAEFKTKFLSGGVLGAQMERRREKILAEFDRLHAEVRAADRGLEPLFHKARERIQKELGRVAEKTRASLAQRESALLARVHYLSALVRPRNRPQERTLCTAQFLAWEPSLPEALLERLDPWVFEHRVVSFAPEAAE